MMKVAAKMMMMVSMMLMMMTTMTLQAVMEPHALRPAYWKWLLRVTHNKYVDVCGERGKSVLVFYCPRIVSMYFVFPRVLIHATEPRAGPTLTSAWAGHRLVPLHLQSGPDLNQKFQVIIAPNMSSVCYTSRPWLCVPDGVPWNASYAQPYLHRAKNIFSSVLTLEPIEAWLACVPG